MKTKTPPKPDKRILWPGWAGNLTPAEYRHLATRISRSRRLQERWRPIPADPEKAEALIRSKAICGGAGAETNQVATQLATTTTAPLRDGPAVWIQLSMELE